VQSVSERRGALIDLALVCDIKVKLLQKQTIILFFFTKITHELFYSCSVNNYKSVLFRMFSSLLIPSVA